MKTRILIALLTLPIIFASCSKKGCRDVNALNFDAEADKDGTCRYTKVIFHAPGDQIGGVADKIVKIEIFRGPTPGQQLIGTIEQMNQDAVSGCVAPMGAFEYELPDAAIQYLFLTRYYYDNGTDESGDSYNIQADKETECRVVELTI